MNFKGSINGIIEVYPQRLPGMAEETHKKRTLMKNNGVLTEIRTEYLQNTSPEHYS
jgi:hypothetical protein